MKTIDEFEPTAEMLLFEEWMKTAWPMHSLKRRKWEAGYFSGQVNGPWRGWEARAAKSKAGEGDDERFITKEIAFTDERTGERHSFDGVSELIMAFLKGKALTHHEAWQHMDGKYHRVMMLLKATIGEHGLCHPRERKACTVCNANDELNRLITDYRGAAIIKSNPPASRRAEEVP